MKTKKPSLNQDQNQWGGIRTGGGRPKGSRTSAGRVKLPQAMRVETLERAHAVLSSDMSPVDVMLGVMRGDETITPRQYQAAVDVAPFICPRLSAVAIAAKGEATLADLLMEVERKRRVPTIEADIVSANTQGIPRLSAPAAETSYKPTDKDDRNRVLAEARAELAKTTDPAQREELARMIKKVEAL
jgi:hypothetical protein